MWKDIFSMLIACSGIAILIAEISAQRGSGQYFAAFFIALIVLLGMGGTVLRKLFKNIDHSKELLGTEENKFKSLSLEEARTRAEVMLHSPRISIQDREVPPSELLTQLGFLAREFFQNRPSVRDAHGELELGIQYLTLRDLQPYGNVIVLGKHGIHSIIVSRPQSEEIIEIAEPESRYQESVVHPSIYHFLARYASLHGLT